MANKVVIIHRIIPWVIPATILLLVIGAWIFRWETIQNGDSLYRHDNWLDQDWLQTGDKEVAVIPKWKIEVSKETYIMDPNSVTQKMLPLDRLIKDNKTKADQYLAYTKEGMTLLNDINNGTRVQNNMSDRERQVLSDYIHIMNNDDSKLSDNFKDLRNAYNTYCEAGNQRVEVEKQFEQELSDRAATLRRKASITSEVIAGAMIVWLIALYLRGRKPKNSKK